MPVKKEKTINLELTIEETNTVLEALGQMPFMRAYRIIEKIHIQAQGNSLNILKAKPAKKSKGRKPKS